MEQIIVLVNILKNAVSVTSFVGTRIYPIHLPQNEDYPFIILNTISTNPQDTKSGPSDFDMPRIQIDIIGSKYDVVADISLSVRNTLDRAIPGIYNDVNVSGIRFIDGRDHNREEDKDLYRISQDYQIIIHR